MKSMKNKVTKSVIILLLSVILIPGLMSQPTRVSANKLDNTNSAKDRNMMKIPGSLQLPPNTATALAQFTKVQLTPQNRRLATNAKAALDWSNYNFPTVFNEDLALIQTINTQLRRKYMNRSEFYKPFEDLELFDNSFITQTTEDTILYANLTPEDFGINSKYFVNNSESVYNTMLKESLFGIDHGYFLGSLDKKELDHGKNEYIQISLMVPKGSEMTRVGSFKESQYIIPRDSTLSYSEKNFNKDSKNVGISAQWVDERELDEASELEEEIINEDMQELYRTPSDLIKLTPLGLNAGYVLTDSLNVVSKTFEKLYFGGIFSSKFFNMYNIHLSNGWLVHSGIFDKMSEGLSFEERQKLFDNRYSRNELGATVSWEGQRKSDTVVTFSKPSELDKLPQMSNSEVLSSTLLHEIFHYQIHTTVFFEDRPLFKEKPDDFKNMMTALKEKNEKALVKLLNDDYATESWQEYICEAFMAKFHPNNEIRESFKKEIPQTNRLLDSLYDVDPPTIPNKLKEVEVGGESVKFTFNHSTDNVGVSMYKIYQNGEYIKSEVTAKDDNGLSYPNPGDYQPNVEILIDSLEQMTEYEFQVTAVDDILNESVKSEVLKVKTKDTEPPELQGDLKGQPLVSSAARFNWPHPTDNHKVKEVKLYRSESSSILRNSLTKNDRTFTIPGNENYYTDTTIEKGKSYNYYMVAIDESGNVSEKSNQVTIKTEDKNDEKQNEDKAENITSSNATLNWSGAFEGISSSGFSIFSWAFSGGSWVFGGITSVAGTATSSLVSLVPGLSHQFVVVPVDAQGNPIADGIQISVDSKDESSIKTKDSTVYVGQKWNKEDNFVSATDEVGNKVDFNDKRILTHDATVDTSKPRVYELKYSYKGIAKTSDATFKVTVEIENGVEIEKAHKSNAIWREGTGPNAVTDIYFKNDIKSVLNGQLDKYRVVYNKNMSGGFDQTRKANDFKPNGSVKVNLLDYNKGKDIRLIQGTKLEIYAVLKNGSEINVYNYRETEQPAYISDFPHNLGEWKDIRGSSEKSISNNGLIFTKKNQTDELISLNLKDIKRGAGDAEFTFLYEENLSIGLTFRGNSSGTSNQSFYYNTDEKWVISEDDKTRKTYTFKGPKLVNGRKYKLMIRYEGRAIKAHLNDKVIFHSRVEFSDGSFINGKLRGNSGIHIGPGKQKLTVLSMKSGKVGSIPLSEVDQSSIKTKDSTLYVGQKWKKEDNFVSATDEEGKAILITDSRITTNGATVDTSKPGVYELKYSYEGSTNISNSRFKVTVKEDKSTIKTKDSTVYVGQKWKKEDNFVSATDEEGKPIPITDSRITTNGANVDTSKPGVYELKYSYKGIFKTSDATFKVTVKEDKSNIKTKDSTIYVGQKWKKEDNFVSATDEVGNKVDFNDKRILTHDATVDTSKPGVYELKYSYKGIAKTSDAAFKVTVKEDKSSIKTKDSTIYVGQKWKKEDNFVSATDEEGKSIPITDSRITTNGAKVDTSKPGVYELKYSYKGIVKTSDSKFKVRVVSNPGWYSNIQIAHRSNNAFIQGSGVNKNGMIFKNNIKRVMNGEPYEYRVVYDNRNGNSFNETRKPYNFKSDGSIEVNFLEYTGGFGLIITNDTVFAIYVVLKNGDEINVYIHDD